MGVAEAVTQGGDMDWGVLVAVASLLVGLPSVFGFFLQRRDYWQKELHEDAVLRRELATRLRDASVGGVYRDTLERALAWLDRVFGTPGSAQALGVCFLVAVAYAWASFFLGWCISPESGKIGGFILLPGNMRLPVRAFLTTLAILLPLLTFYLSRWIARWLYRCERLLQAGLLLLWRKRRCKHNFFVLYGWLVIGLWFSLLYFAVTKIDRNIAAEFFLFTVPILGAQCGHAAARYWKGLRTELVSFAAGMVVFLLSIIINYVGITIGINIGAVVVAGVVAVAIALSGFATSISAGVLFIIMAMAMIMVEIGAKSLNLTIGIALALTLPAALTAAISSSREFLRWRSNNQVKSLWAGGFGCMLGLAGFAIWDSRKHTEDELAIWLLLFFLILPLVNSLFDWLSWWATRALGRRLLTTLESVEGGWRRAGAAIAGHGLLDLAAAVVLLLIMAYALGLGFESYNGFAVLSGGKPAFALEPMIQVAAAAPWHTGFWLSAMLFTTLLPTFGHGLMLAFSPLGYCFIPGRTCLELADELDNYQTAGEQQPSIRRRAALWCSQSRLLAWSMALLLLVLLLGRLAAFIALLYTGGLSGVAAEAGYSGIHSARWLLGLLHGGGA